MTAQIIDGKAIAANLSKFSHIMRETLESYYRGVLMVPSRSLFIARLDGVIAGAIAAGLAATACTSSGNTERGAVGGALLGAAAGAVIGNNTGSGDAGQGAAIGAATGAIAGGVAGMPPIALSTTSCTSRALTNDASRSICVNSGWRSARRSSSRKQRAIWKYRS